MAQLGFRTVVEMVGHSELLDMKKAIEHWKARGLDFSKIFHKPVAKNGSPLHQTIPQDHGIDKALDNLLIQRCAYTLETGNPITLEFPVRNVNRTVGTMLGSELTRRHGAAGLPDDTITLNFTGSAGQSFGAFLPKGITLKLEGDANDYVGKGLSGGKIVVRPPRSAKFNPQDNIIAGNVIGYGATGGELYLRGTVGERFCVRNSGINAVVEGVGDHGCEYMTGGRVLVLGKTGRNFAAGMSGGIAYVYDADGTFTGRCNRGMVEIEELEAEDRDFICEKVEKHIRHTGSTVALDIQQNWTRASKKFVRVMPVEFKRVMKQQREALEKASAAAGE
jgi:glutamate synthase (NADPH/NADH) large chain